ncbi:MAG: [FeFe] hydrogenase H-cluster radical SAM maturase HydE [Heliobacteriaceae bacterium]|jgi:biotin synthase|nr:[FeFe] hydrogenase H-cluster radical SAM maturase HydE [Heliobacteriaceae bacterium]
MNALIVKAKKTHTLTEDELAAILSDDTVNDELFKSADKVRKEYAGEEVHLRGLIEFSNICKRGCLYCGIRSANRKVERYRLTKEEILDFANKAAGYGYKTLVMQSGEDDYFTAEILADILHGVKKLNVAVTLSIGERTLEEYQTLKEAGADRFLLRIETTDEELYRQMHPNMSLQARKQCLYNLKEAGFEVGTGCLVGLPGQTAKSLARDILFFKSLDADMIGIGPFIPNKNTPLANTTGGNFTLALKVMALTRLLLPDINIPATTAMETLDPNGRIKALQSGANVVMPNVTEGDYRRKYELYPGKICINDAPAKCRNCITGKITAIGRTVSSDYGFRRRKNV